MSPIRSTIVVLTGLCLFGFARLEAAVRKEPEKPHLLRQLQRYLAVRRPEAARALIRSYPRLASELRLELGFLREALSPSPLDSEIRAGTQALALLPSASQDASLASLIKTYRIYCKSLRMGSARARADLLRFKQAAESSGVETALAVALRGLADLNTYGEFRLQEAEGFYERAFGLFERYGCQKNMALVLEDMGFLYQRLGETGSAYATYREAAEVWQSLRAFDRAAQALRRAGEAQELMDEPLGALATYREALRWRRQGTDRAALASDLCFIAARVTDAPVDALLWAQEALNLSSSLGRHDLILQSLSTLETLSRRQGRPAEAEAFRKKKEAEKERLLSTDRQLVSRLRPRKSLTDDEARSCLHALERLSDAAQEQGRPVEALRLAEDAASFCRTAQSPVLLRESLWNLAGRLAAEKDLKRLETAFQEILATSQKERDSREMVRYLNRIGQAWESLDRPSKAIEHFRIAASLGRQLEDVPDLLTALENIARLEAGQANIDQVLKCQEEAVSITRQNGLGRRDLSARLIRLAETQTQKGDLPTAILRYEEALSLWESSQDSSEEAIDESGEVSSIYEKLILLSLKTGQKEQARGYLRKGKSARLLTALHRAELEGDSRVAEMLADADLQESDKTSPRQALRQGDAAEGSAAPRPAGHPSRLLADTKESFLAAANDIRRWNRDYDRMVPIKPVQLAKLQERIPEKTAILEYFPGETQLYIFLIRRDRMAARSVPVSRDTLEGLIRHFRYIIARCERRVRLGQSIPSPENWQDDGSTTFQEEFAPLKETLTRLYAHLIEPVREDLEGVERLAIAPTGALWYLPLGALSRELPGGSLKFLVEEMQVCSLSSGELLDIFGPQVPPLNPDRDRVLVLADPDGSLPGARVETEAIRKAFPHAISFVGPEATRQRLRNLPEGCRAVHIAAHGLLNASDPNATAIALRGRLRLDEIYGLPLQGISLVMLSACGTALGEDQPGSEIAGLAQAFSAAGARSVAASLWSVSDRATAALVESFYRRLASGSSKSEALRQAALEVMRMPGFAHPYYWSAFSLIGDPR